MESLIAVVLTAVVGVGMTFALTRAAVGQAKLNAQSTVVTQLRSQVQAQGMNSMCANAATTTTTTTTTSGNKAGSQASEHASSQAHEHAASNSAVRIGTTAVKDATLQCDFQQLTVSVGSTSKTVLVPVLSYAVSDDRLGSSALLLRNSAQ